MSAPKTWLARLHLTFPDIAVVIAAVVSICVALGTFFTTFGIAPFSKLETWGPFGDFVGGTLNPIIGLATALLVISTLRETRKAAAAAERDNTQRRAIEYGNRRLEHALNAWDKAIEAPIRLRTTLNAPRNQAYFEGKSLRQILQSEANQQELRMIAEESPILSRHWATPLAELLHLLQEIDEYCIEMDLLDTTKVVSNFYRHRVNFAVRFLSHLQVLDASLAARLTMPIGLPGGLVARPDFSSGTKSNSEGDVVAESQSDPH